MSYVFFHIVVNVKLHVLFKRLWIFSLEYTARHISNLPRRCDLKKSNSRFTIFSIIHQKSNKSLCKGEPNFFHISVQTHNVYSFHFSFNSFGHLYFVFLSFLYFPLTRISWLLKISHTGAKFVHPTRNSICQIELKTPSALYTFQIFAT